MDELLIAVIGPSGSGKSTFINTVSGSTMKVATGNIQKSCTALVEATEHFLVGDRKIVLLDTPGFDNDTLTLSDEDIVEAVEEYMKAKMEGKKLDGIIYLQAIDDRKSREVETNLKAFEPFFRDGSPHPVALVTTMWDLVQLKTGETREKELKEDDEFWAPALKRGASVQRHDGTKESAEKAILSLLSAQVASQPPLHLDSPLEVRSVHQSYYYLIAVMGPTSSGKSTFVNLASGSNDQAIGAGLRSCTTEVTCTKPFLLQGKWVVLLDTPGFDDTSTTDFDILEKIATYMSETYKEKKLLDGILYFHNISNNRMGGAVIRNLRLLESLCGPDPLEYVVMVTNMWDALKDTKIVEDRENELKRDPAFFGGVLLGGATLKRHTGTVLSSHQILSDLLEIGHRRRRLDIQAEMVDERRRLDETTAAKALSHEFEEMIKDLERRIKRKKDQRSSRTSQERKSSESEIKTMKVKVKELKASRREISRSNDLPWWHMTLLNFIKSMFA